MKKSLIITKKREENYKAVELTGLTVYSIGAFFMSLMLIIREKSVLAFILFLIMILSNWIVYISEKLEYNIRIICLSISESILIFTFAYYSDAFINVLTPIIILSVIHVLYKSRVCLIIDVFTGIITAFFNIYRVFIVSITNYEAAIEIFIQICAVFLLQYLCFYIMKSKISDEALQDALVGDLSEAEESKNDFMANMSHELRTPINSILGTSSILLDHNLSAEDKDYLFSLEESGFKLLNVVNDIMDYTMLSSSTLSLNEAPYVITSIINDTASFINTKNKNKNISVFFDVDPTIPSSLFGDSEKIMRIIVCLLDNALKFTHSGTIVLKVSYRNLDYGINLCIKVIDTGIGMDEKTLENLRSGIFVGDSKSARRQEGAGLGLSVACGLLSLMDGFLLIDSTYGKGSEFSAVIPQKVMNSSPSVVVEHNTSYNLLVYTSPEFSSVKNMREFYTESILSMLNKLHINSTFVKTSAELKSIIAYTNFSHILLSEKAYLSDREYYDGLANKVHFIVVSFEQNNKELPDYIRRLYLPFYGYHLAELLMHDKDIKPSEQYIASKKFIAPKARVLVVDDNKTNLKVIEGLLKKYKINTILCRSGSEALDKCRAKDYNFIFMDHMMPEMDGIETMHKIKNISDPFFQQLPVIALTANAVGGAREMFLSEGFSDFVSKPINKRELERILLSYLPADYIEYINENLVNNKTVDKKEDKTVSVTENNLTSIDKEKAIQLLNNDEEIYSAALDAYINDSVEYINLLDRYFNEKNCKEYSVIIHAVKSSSQSIGAFELSNAAALLETSSNNFELDKSIKLHTDVLLAYKQIISKLKG